MQVEDEGHAVKLQVQVRDMWAGEGYMGRLQVQVMGI